MGNVNCCSSVKDQKKPTGKKILKPIAVERNLVHRESIKSEKEEGGSTPKRMSIGSRRDIQVSPINEAEHE